MTYEIVEFEQFLALFRKLHIMHGSLPTICIAANGNAHGPRKDLVAKTHADDSDSFRLESFGCVFDQLEYPWRVCKAVMSCTCQYMTQSRVYAMDVLEPVISSASTLSRSGYLSPCSFSI